MISPVVVIATHDRLQITTVNIKQLISQGVKVVLVITDINERNHYDNYDVNIVMAPNNPLGAKWQFGVEYARQFDPSHIVITGSDDLLSMGFFEKYCVEGYHPLTGFKQWYILNKEKLYLLKYMIQQPLGGGRVYSKKALSDLNWKLFDVTKNKFLDDYTWKRSGGWVMYHEPEILAVKGNWPVMNKVDLNHRNVKLLATYEGDEALKIMKEHFNYEP